MGLEARIDVCWEKIDEQSVERGGEIGWCSLLALLNFQVVHPQRTNLSKGHESEFWRHRSQGCHQKNGKSSHYPFLSGRSQQLLLEDHQGFGEEKFS